MEQEEEERFKLIFETFNLYMGFVLLLLRLFI